MAPLSNELAGVVLPHDSFGSHLDASGWTTDGNLKRQNFQLAEETLVEVIFSSPGLLMIFNIFSRAGSS